MANEYKIYVIGNFLEIEDTNNGYFTDIKKGDAKIVRHDNSNEWYDIYNKNNKVFSKIFLSQILDQNGDAYTFEAFEEFRTCSIGEFIIGWSCSNNN